MTETTAQPLTREDVAAAVIEALGANVVNVTASVEPNSFRLIGTSEEMNPDSGPRPLTEKKVRATTSGDPEVFLLNLRFQLGESTLGIDQATLKLDDRFEELGGDPGQSSSRIASALVKGFEELEARRFADGELLGQNDCAELGPDVVTHKTSPSVDGCGDPTVGETGSVGGTSVSSTEKVDDPRISARYDRPLNMIAISVDGEDDVYLPRDGAFTFSDEIAQALEVQAKLGGAA
ncbi:hypothetical protein AAC389_15855 [Rhodococcus qingshengii]|uniref:hypothetical protein n=1 Tax=Rhodococcus qingshengii TaxID=334542 RepID=UPI00311CC1F4